MKLLGHFNFQDVKKWTVSKIEKESFGGAETTDNRAIEICLDEGKILLTMMGRDLRLESEKEVTDGQERIGQDRPEADNIT